MLEVWLKGLLLGLAIAAPVGPIGVLCIRRTLAWGWGPGLVSGLGAATADGLYGCIAGFGLTTVAEFLTAQALPLRLGGGAFLCYLGITTFLAKPTAGQPSGEGRAATSPHAMVADEPTGATHPRRLPLLSAYTSTLVLTLTNPATIFSFAAIFAGLGIVESGQDYAKSGVLVLGVWGGSALWWLFLSAMVSLLRSRLTPIHMAWLNRGSGIVILAFGLVALTVVI